MNPMVNGKDFTLREKVIFYGKDFNLLAQELEIIIHMHFPIREYLII
jgi:hypothetical protein